MCLYPPLCQVAASAQRPASGGVLSASELLAADVPALLKASARQLKEKSVKTRAGAFTVLQELLLARPDAVTGQADLVLPGILSALNVCYTLHYFPCTLSAGSSRCLVHDLTDVSHGFDCSALNTICCYCAVLRCSPCPICDTAGYVISKRMTSSISGHFVTVIFLQLGPTHIIPHMSSDVLHASTPGVNSALDWCAG